MLVLLEKMLVLEQLLLLRLLVLVGVLLWALLFVKLKPTQASRRANHDQTKRISSLLTPTFRHATPAGPCGTPCPPCWVCS